MKIDITMATVGAMGKKLTMTRHKNIQCLYNLDNIPWNTNSIINNRFQTAFAILAMFSAHSKRSLWIPEARLGALTLRLAWGQFETICEITPWILPWWGGRPNYILITTQKKSQVYNCFCKLVGVASGNDCRSSDFPTMQQDFQTIDDYL